MTFWTVVAILLGYYVYKDNKKAIHEHIKNKKKSKIESSKSNTEDEETKIEAVIHVRSPFLVPVGEVISISGDEVIKDGKKSIILCWDDKGRAWIYNEDYSITCCKNLDSFKRTGRHINLGWLFDKVEEDDDI